MKRLLILRFSAFGDVAMTVPVIREFLEQNPGVQITFVSHHALAPLFERQDGVAFFPADFHGRHKGPAGLFRLHREVMRQGPYDAVIDLHSVIRTHFLRTLFRLRGLRIFKINKNRRARKALTRRENKIKLPLRPIPERYADVFRRAGFPLTLSNCLQKTPRSLSAETLQALGVPAPAPAEPWIGVAPFSWYPGKTYPSELMLAAVKEIAASGNCRILLFGGRGREAEELERWRRQLPCASVVAGKLSLREELDVISHLKVMVSMDSANMHLASAVGTRAVSIWGATHPYAGFLGYGQSLSDAVEADMDCRPCSTFGNKPCFKNTYGCLYAIPPAQVVRAVRRAAGL